MVVKALPDSKIRTPRGSRFWFINAPSTALPEKVPLNRVIPAKPLGKYALSVVKMGKTIITMLR